MDAVSDVWNLGRGAGGEGQYMGQNTIYIKGERLTGLEQVIAFLLGWWMYLLQALQKPALGLGMVVEVEVEVEAG